MTARFTKMISLVCVCLFLGVPAGFGVTSKVTRHGTKVDFDKGKTRNVIISSKGVVQLGRSAEVLLEKFNEAASENGAEAASVEPWAINCIVVDGATTYIGTSPNGGIYKYNLGELKKLYSAEIPQEINEPNDPNSQGDQPQLANEHIFAMSKDISGRLLAGISGRQCKLMRLEDNKFKTIFEPEPNDAKYIFAIAVSPEGDIYLGTGPEGKLYHLDSFGKKGEVVYDCVDKNILSLAVGKDGYVYAGTDGRGLVYKINPKSKTATVLYDTEQPEVTGLLFGEDGVLYAAATSAKIAEAEGKFAKRQPMAGKPEASADKAESKSTEGGLKLKIANTSQKQGEPSPKAGPGPKPAKSQQVSYVYKVTKEGFVTDVFSEQAVFFCMAKQAEQLLIGTGNTAELFGVDPAIEEDQTMYSDEQASQITAVVAVDGSIYIGTANPAKLIKIADKYAAEGTYESDLIDAGQPAMWGKLQIEADIPKGCSVKISSRSGNVQDINDPTFSEWTNASEITEPVQLKCPTGRFCQYKLLLQTKQETKSPLIREVAVAETVPNLAPRVEVIQAAKDEAEGKEGIFKISYKASDDNEDKLIYKIDFRKTGRTGWIEIKDKVEADNFEWDSRTVEDGRYEIRVTANDERSNTSETALTGSRISEPIVIDNTGPSLAGSDITEKKGVVTLKLKVSDELSAVDMVEYTIDSNTDWIGTLPDDLVYDTLNESFTIVTKKLEAGEHVIALKLTDAAGNVTYKSFTVEIKGN